MQKSGLVELWVMSMNLDYETFAVGPPILPIFSLKICGPSDCIAQHHIRPLRLS